MDLTPENKAYIDKMTYIELLSRWRFSADSNTWFQGDTGQYWSQRMTELRDIDPQAAVQASKTIGWR